MITDTQKPIHGERNRYTVRTLYRMADRLYSDIQTVMAENQAQAETIAWKYVLENNYDYCQYVSQNAMRMS